MTTRVMWACLLWCLGGQVGPAVAYAAEVPHPAGVAVVGWDILRAQDLYDGLKFEATEQAVAQALSRPGRSRQELAALYRLRGLLAAARDDNQRARQDFVRWLTLDPQGRLPEGVAPKISEPYHAALREQRRAVPLGLRPAVAAEAGPVLRVEVVGDRARLGQAVLVSYAMGGAAGTLRGDVAPDRGAEGNVLLRFPLTGLPRGKLFYTVELLGEQGGRLAQAGSLAAPLVAYPFGREPLYRKWWLWTAAAGLTALGLGLGIGLGTR